VSEEDQTRWDEKHRRSLPPPAIEPPPPPPLFAHVEQRFPSEGQALDIACGRGEGAVWLAGRGLNYLGLDISPVAIEIAQEFVSAYPYGDRCSFEIWDLDRGLPPGDPVDLLFCHMFRPVGLYEEMIDRLAPGGLVAVAALSEVGGKAGPYRCEPGELREAFDALEIIDEGEGDGVARIMARKRGSDR
jgi:SAM-dependent methyltransferase